MGRDDAKTVPGLQGGTAPARAFHDFMSVAIANRPVEQFETQVPLPDWQLTPEEEVYGASAIDANGDAADGRRERHADRYCRRPRAGLSAATTDGPARRHRRPDEQELDQAFPPQHRSRSRSLSANRSRRQPRSRRRSRDQRPRPTRRSRGPMRRSTAFASARPGAEQPRFERLELRTVIEVDEMRDLVGNDVAPHVGRREDQPPAIADPPCDEQLPQRVRHRRP